MKVLICGDFLAHRQLKVNDKNIFGDFIEVIESSDLKIYNQEHPVTTSNEVYTTKKYGTVDSCHPDLIKPFIEAGFNIVTLATNHIFNRGISGLEDTLSFFKSKGISCLGAGRNISEASKILYIEKDQCKIAFLNFAEHEYNIATENHGGANPIDIIGNANQIREARSKADFVFVIIHGGLEYCEYPTPRMVKQFRFYAENGASAVLCHHSHVISGYEVYKGCPIFYGLGNFVPAKDLKIIYNNPKTRISISVQFELSKGHLKFRYFLQKYDLTRGTLENVDDSELKEIKENINRINKALNDPLRLKEEILRTYFNKEREAYYYTIFTRSNYFLFKFFRKSSLIRIYNAYIKKKMGINWKNSVSWNLLRCETHNDILNIVYDKYIDAYKNED